MILTNKWHESAIDTNLYFQMQDLTTVLSQLNDLEFEFTYGSHIDVDRHTLSASTLWESTPYDIKRAGYTTDVYLRAIGTMHLSHLATLKEFNEQLDELPLPLFISHLFTLFEDMRLEEEIKKIRPGTVTLFEIRNNYLRKYFKSQLTVMTTRGKWLEALFCMIFLQVHSNTLHPDFPSATEQLEKTIDKLKMKLTQAFEVKTTEDCMNLSFQIMYLLNDEYKDMTHTYFTFPISHLREDWKENSLFDQLTRTDDLANQDQEEVDPENSEYIDETFSTWHRENENSDRKQTFLQMDLDVGTKTNLTGGTARETESGDQAFGTAQGQSKQAKQDDYSKMESLDRHEDQEDTSKAKQYGAANVDAIQIDKYPNEISQNDVLAYEEILSYIEPYKRKLTQSIEKWLEHKRSDQRTGLTHGRLSNKLLKVVTEDYPKIFYKKDEDSHEFDAVFTLMVDCSASMFQKMDETKRGIVLFHEVLKHLKIPHSIVGFWEDATSHQSKNYPNYFHWIHQFSDSLYENNGPKIMQLEAEEDNRDGYSIRVVAEKMKERREKHKYLLVFSDGEPAAANYDKTGMTDTYDAVNETRKHQIDVIGMFLSDGNITEADETLMRTIYGNEHILVNHLSELPDLFLSLLKKLLMNTGG